MNVSSTKFCSVFGHSEIVVANNLSEQLVNLIENLIVKEYVEYFLFGGFGLFDELCHEIVSDFRIKYPFIKRIYCYEREDYLNPYKRPKYLKIENMRNLCTILYVLILDTNVYIIEI